ncbi:MAG TPA: hypothetical protein VF762_04160 [Blastocatellia bacterium]
MDTSPKTIDLLVEDLLFSPNLYLRELDQERRTATFIRMDRANYVRSAFLDDRAVRDDLSDYQLDLDDLLDIYESNAVRLRPVHYIFHMAFGCSTLLARCLESVKGCFVLKEPLALHQLAAARSEIGDSPDALRSWHKTLRLTMSLLSKTYSPSDAVIIKADCASIMDDLLDLEDKSRGLFLYSEQRSFLVSILKSHERREWVRRRLSETLKRASLSGGDSFPFNADVNHLSDAEAAGMFWLTQIYIYREMQGSYKSRLMALNGDEFVESPYELLSEMLKHLGIKGVGRRWFERICGDILSNHSKTPGLKYDRGSRKQELETLFQIFKDELRRGEVFINAILDKLGWAEIIPPATCRQAYL